MRGITFLMAMACVTSAAAQTAPPTMGDPRMIGQANRAEMSRMAVRNQVEGIRRREFENEQDRVVNAERREALAARLSEMANNGECRQAVAIARREDEVEMAARLVNMCRLPARLY